MMDVGISGAAPAPDAAAAAKSAAAVDKANGGGEKSGGFLDALRNARSQQQDASDDTADSPDDADQNTETPAGTSAAPAEPPRPKKPVIDLMQSRPIVDEPQAARPETDTAAKDAAQTKALKDKLLKAQAAGEAASRDRTEIAEDPHVVKLAKMTAGGKDKIGTDQSDEDDLSDVLSLLGSKDDADVKTSAQQTAQQVVLPHHAAAATPATDAKARSNADTGKIADALSAVHAARVASDKDVAVPGTDTETETGSATLFRLTRADGRGKSLDISAGGRTDESAADIRQAKSEKIENVSVLESRRYLGLAQNSNSSSVVSALSSDSEWSTAMQPSSALSNAASWTSTGKVVNTLKIQMHPIELGLVTATMRLQGEELSVDLKVENGTAYRQLKEDQSKIVESLRAQGFAIDNVTISIAAVDRSDSNGQAGNQGQSQQQAFQNQGQGDQAQDRQQPSSPRQTENGRGGSVAETGVGDAQAADAGRGRPGYVYM